MKKYTFNTNGIRIREELKKALEVKNLSLLHENPRFTKTYISNSPVKDQSDVAHKVFYEKCNLDSEFYKYYLSIVRALSIIAFPDTKKIIYQTIPSFRIQQPNNLSVSEFHRDRDYFHFPQEVNFFLPFTKAYDTNTIWIESEEGKADYSPIEADYGEIVEFDGANLAHGNKVNMTEKTRISIDFRMMDYSHYKDRPEISTIATKTNMNLGHYYSLLT